MKRISVAMLLCFFAVTLVSAMGGGAPDKPAAGPQKTTALAGTVFLVDDFESGSIKSPREWWTFDISKADAVSNKDYKGGDETVSSQVGNYSMLFQGNAKNWYVGGAGTYLAKENQDLSVYSGLSMDIFGNGPGSGTLKIELADDDNNNWQVEQDPSKGYAFTADDKFVYEQRVDWNGWKRVYLPFADFTDDNPLVGDDVWNPQQVAGSGGLLQVQYVCIAPKADAKVNFNLDNIMFTMGNK
ncbi:MAG: hypothetical protein WCV91_05815 [Candidatus Margulisiibacteriota bacterium]